MKPTITSAVTVCISRGGGRESNSKGGCANLLYLDLHLFDFFLKKMHEKKAFQ